MSLFRVSSPATDLALRLKSELPATRYFTESERVTMHAATGYMQFMARGDVEAGEAEDMVEAVKQGALIPAETGAR